MTSAVKILCDGTIKATLLILMERGVEKDDIDNGLVADAVKTVLKERIDRVFKEWAQATDALTPQAWLRELLNAQCNELALEAVAWHDEAAEQMRDSLYDAGVGYGR